jgi:hypothetical protein
MGSWLCGQSRTLKRFVNDVRADNSAVPGDDAIRFDLNGK